MLPVSVKITLPVALPEDVPVREHEAVPDVDGETELVWLTLCVIDFVADKLTLAVFVVDAEVLADTVAVADSVHEG